MEFHLEQLQKHCRICGKRLNKAKGKPQPVYSCSDHTDDISAFLGVVTCTVEDQHIFPQKFCGPCHTRLTKAKKANQAGFPSYPIVAMEWTSHQEDCRVRKKGGNVKNI